MAGCALLATSIEAFSPLAFSHLVNAIAAAVGHHGDFSTIRPWIFWLAAIWLGGALTYRLYDFVDRGTGPRMRGLAQKYLFTYLLGHSPRYFQDNFAGKLGQKVKQAGQSVIGILGIACMDLMRVIRPRRDRRGADGDPGAELCRSSSCCGLCSISPSCSRWRGAAIVLCRKRCRTKSRPRPGRLIDAILRTPTWCAPSPRRCMSAEIHLLFPSPTR